MIVTPIEEFDTARWKKYQKDITDLAQEFNEWAKAMQVKYLGALSEEQKEKMMHRMSDDARYMISVDVAKLLGKE
jgi:hypothetical protein